MYSYIYIYCTCCGSEQYPRLCCVLLKWRHANYLDWVLSPFETTPLLLSCLSFHPPSHSLWPCHFLHCQSVCLLLMGAQSCCLLQSSLPADAQLMLRQPHLFCCCIPFRWPRLNPRTIHTQKTQKCPNTRKHVCVHPRRMSEKPVCEL